MRRRRLHIGPIRGGGRLPVDLEKFMDDALWERAGYERLFTEEYMAGKPRNGAEGREALSTSVCTSSTRSSPSGTWVTTTSTVTRPCLIEFSRGGTDGFRKALALLDPRHPRTGGHLLHPRVARGIVAAQRRAVTRRSSGIRSWRTWCPARPTSTSTASTTGRRSPAGRPSGWLDIGGSCVPFVTMNNEPESTDPAVLEPRYAGALGQLWELRSERS